MNREEYLRGKYVWADDDIEVTQEPDGSPRTRAKAPGLLEMLARRRDTRLGAPNPVSRTYKRDQQGRFSSGGGVRQSLADAASTDEVNAAMAAEARRITGRDTAVDFTGSDVQIAREHAEGLLRAQERYPGVRIDRVGMGDSGRTTEVEAFASTSPDGRSITFTHDAQKYGADSYRQDLRNEEAEGFSATGTPTGVALHEFGHAVADQYNGYRFMDQNANDYVQLVMKREDVAAAVSSEISRYAATSSHEMVAEAFADVMVNGKAASGLSDHIVGSLDAKVRLAEMGL